MPDGSPRISGSSPHKLSTPVRMRTKKKSPRQEEDECDGEGNPCESLTYSPRSPSFRAANATRLPHHALVNVFSYLSMSDLRSCMLTCRQWNNVLSLEDSVVWSSLVQRNVPESALADPYLLSELTSSKKKLRSFCFAWNPNDASRNNYVRTNGYTVHRQPVAQSTDGIRGKRGISSGVHAFDIVWEGPLGTVAVVGFATKHAALHCIGYVALLGSDDQSWGWNLVDNVLMHNAQSLGVYPSTNNPPKYEMGERLRLVIDCDQHVAYFERGHEFFGVAFRHLPPVRLFPAVCAVYGNTEVSMVYVGSPAMG
ncbi:unnamed protein product [Caenorhabditis auriculariae]|uniref:F-box/SPRY domain-containing protein 1 n=1 Tax=Caenorhabditis auriculariae TaxID=2777116 RepID=A0A8S1GWT0_9PELO|nr:unnamed protein product [Caenorhabditis auriculariae]